MTDRAGHLDRITDDIHALTTPRTHNEPVFTWTKQRNRKLTTHATRQPSLLDQLRHLAHHPETTPPAGNRRPAPESRTPGGTAALDHLHHIDTMARHWISHFRWTLDIGHHPRPTTESALTVLGLYAHTCDPDTLTALATDTAAWRRTAEIITGWRDPDHRLNARCPTCNTPGTLTATATPTATTVTCTTCTTTWTHTDGTLTTLTNHLRNDTPATDPA